MNDIDRAIRSAVVTGKMYGEYLITKRTIMEQPLTGVVASSLGYMGSSLVELCRGKSKKETREIIHVMNRIMATQAMLIYDSYTEAQPFGATTGRFCHEEPYVKEVKHGETN